MEGILQSIITAGYRNLEGRSLALFRFDPLSDTFPDVWEVEGRQVTRRYTSRAAGEERIHRILRSDGPVLVEDAQRQAAGGDPLFPGVRAYIGVPVQVHGLPWGVLCVLLADGDSFGEEDLAFVQSLGRQIGTIIQESHPLPSGSAEISTVRVLAATVDAKDHYTRHHSTNVAFYARLLAREMNLDPEEVRRIELAGLLHDIGKIAIPDQILQKPGSLTAEERMLIQTHAAIGANILAQAPHLRPLVPLVRHHHEWYDGSGYPDRLKGDAIPLGAAILSLADAFDTMTTRRVYRPAHSVEKAMAEVRHWSGRQFHPAVAAAMESLVEKARYTREPWLLDLGAHQGNGPDPLEAAMWQGVLTGETGEPATKWDPLDFLVEARSIQQVETLPAILQRSGEQALHFWAADAVQIYLIERRSGTLALAWSDGTTAGEPFLQTVRNAPPAPMHEGLLGWAAMSNQGITVADARHDPRWQFSEAFEGPVSILLAPVAVGGSTLGVLQVVARGESRFGGTDVKVVQVFASLMGQAIDRVERARENQEAYCTDALTGLWNANYLRPFLERLGQGEVAHPLAVAFLDGDDLKRVNDRHGHGSGDLTICHIARCLAAHRQEGDVIIRYGGDGFLLFFPGHSLTQAAARVEAMRSAICQTPVEVDGSRLRISVSGGVAMADPSLGPHRAVRAAELAMYEAKRLGKNRVWTATA